MFHEFKDQHGRAVSIDVMEIAAFRNDHGREIGSEITLCSGKSISVSNAYAEVKQTVSDHWQRLAEADHDENLADPDEPPDDPYEEEERAFGGN